MVGSRTAGSQRKSLSERGARRLPRFVDVLSLLPVLSAVEVTDWAGDRPAWFPGGQRQRFTIARSLVNDPVIVWADEPTGALDSKTADDIIALRRRLTVERGLTLVLVTHDQGSGQPLPPDRADARRRRGGPQRGGRDAGVGGELALSSPHPPPLLLSQRAGYPLGGGWGGGVTPFPVSAWGPGAWGQRVRWRHRGDRGTTRRWHR